MRCILSIIFFLFSYSIANAQYNMSDLTVSDCEGVLLDSESNSVSPSYYSNSENYSFTICPANAISLVIDFSSFDTEPINDYLRIFDGPDTNAPLLAGPFSGTSIPPQIITGGCVTINFISDVNITASGFELNWEAQIIAPQPPVLSFPTTPNCSTTTLVMELDQSIHCDSVATAQITVGGQLSQIVSAVGLNCINDSTNQIELTLTPGLNASGNYTVFFQSSFKDDCDSIWELSSYQNFIINDCPLLVDLVADNDTICIGDCTDLYANVSGGDSTSYSYNWIPFLGNSPGNWTVCPAVTTSYIVMVDDTFSAGPEIDTVTIVVVAPPTTQASFSICQTDVPVSLTASPLGGYWSGPGIINSSNGTFSPIGLAAGVHTVSYTIGSCTDDLDITVLGVNAGPDISACLNTTFNLNSSVTTPGGSWSGCNCIQANGILTTPNFPTVITAIYTLPNGCSDTLLITVAGISVQMDDTICQSSGVYNLTYSPPNGVWSVLPDTTQLVSACSSSVAAFPYQQGFELGFGDWTHDPLNDFDWEVNSGPTASSNTGPSAAYQGYNYIYTEASGANNPSKRAGIISPCINLSAYSNPILHFRYHKYGAGQGTFAVDISTNNGVTWNNNIWFKSGNLGNAWHEAIVDLSSFNTAQVKLRLRVKTGNFRSDVAVDQLAILGGPVTVDGNFLTDVASAGMHNLMYSINGCDAFVSIFAKEINAGVDYTVCPTQIPFNLVGAPANGLWGGSHITNTALGTFDPSLGTGVAISTYSFDGCSDTAEVWVVNTNILVDTLTVCINSGIQYLNGSTAPRVPWSGTWSGPGIVVTGSVGQFNPLITGVGTHVVTFTANGCSDDLIIKVNPQAVFLDTLICMSAPDFILNVSPIGGSWSGNGIVNTNLGLFSPSIADTGIHTLVYTLASGCIDTFNIMVYNNVQPVLNGLVSSYCFKDTNIVLTMLPAGGVLSGNGISANYFNPADAGEGYHTITYEYGSGVCLATVSAIVFVGNELIGNAYATSDSICSGDFINIGVNASGGTSNYSFSWDNSLSNSFNHLVNPELTTSYTVVISDGCSDSLVRSIPIYVHPSFSTNFNTSSKQCYDTYGFAKVLINPAGSYSYLWNTSPPKYSDSISDLVNKTYEVEIKDNISKCVVSDTITIPGYDDLVAFFFPNKTECISLLDGNFQFLDNSSVNPNELSLFSYWDFGDSLTLPYIFSENPTHIYTDTGLFNVELVLENNGGCMDSFAVQVCITPDNKIFYPNSFTPNGDLCNDEYYVKGVGEFYYFNIKIHQRWGGDIVFESEEIKLTQPIDEINICNSALITDPYYRMGSWDGILLDGTEAPQGIYPFIIRYQQSKTSPFEEVVGYITLIR